MWRATATHFLLSILFLKIEIKLSQPSYDVSLISLVVSFCIAPHFFKQGVTYAKCAVPHRQS